MTKKKKKDGSKILKLLSPTIKLYRKKSLKATCLLNFIQTHTKRTILYHVSEIQLKVSEIQD